MSARCPTCWMRIPVTEVHGKFVCKHCGSRLMADTRVASLACLASLAAYGMLLLLLPMPHLTAELGLPLAIFLLFLLTCIVLWLEVQVFRALVDIALRPQPKRRPTAHSLTPHRARNRFHRPKR